MCLLIPLCGGALALASAGIASSTPAAANGPITFEEIAAQSGINFSIDSSPSPKKNQIETMVAGVALIDYDGDCYQDIFFANGAAIPSLQKEGPQYKNRPFHNNGDGTFTDASDKAGVGGGIYDGKKMWSVAAAWVDYNNDGLLDLFVSNYVKWEVNKDPECVIAGNRNYCSPVLYERLPAPAWPAVASSTPERQESSIHGRNDSERPWSARLPPPRGAISTDRFRNRGPVPLDAVPRPPA